MVRDEPRVRRAVRPRYEKGTVGKGLVAHCRFASQPFLTIRGTVAPWLMTVPSSPSRRARSLRRVYNPFVLSSVFICWSNLGLEDRNLLLIHMFLYYISYVGPKDPRYERKRECRKGPISLFIHSGPFHTQPATGK